MSIDRAILYVATGDKLMEMREFVMSVISAATDFLEPQVKLVMR